MNTNTDFPNKILDSLADSDSVLSVTTYYAISITCRALTNLCSSSPSSGFVYSRNRLYGGCIKAYSTGVFIFNRWRRTHFAVTQL